MDQNESNKSGNKRWASKRTKERTSKRENRIKNKMRYAKIHVTFGVVFKLDRVVVRFFWPTYQTKCVETRDVNSATPQTQTNKPISSIL